MAGNTTQVLTVGHSTHTIEAFLALLRQHAVTAIADVRSSPYSRFNPQFNRESLEQILKASGIRYVFLGRELGARSDDLSCYENGQVQYARLARTELFQSGIERVLKGAADLRIALMCAEKDPLDCHRTLLVARALADRGVTIEHVLADGQIESHAATMERLFDVTGMPREDLFHTHAELLQQAISKQESRIAYVDEQLAISAKN
ncbi:MAG: DUF488 domain-containing protein [Gammaproteobacteria bacterium]|nr:DUF488 domain-containing protein [Gammaproteobacteria bacterium]